RIKKLCSESGDEYLVRLADSLNPCHYISEKIFREIAENPPALSLKGGLINAGVHQQLDELRKIATGGKEYLVELQQKEASFTGVSSLRIGFNNVFGYYLEVTNSHKNKVPADWIRKQTLTNAERYITPELKEYEEKITGAEEKIIAIETDCYDKLLLELQDYIASIQVNGNILAILDCLICFAENALHYNYKKPELHDGYELDVKDC